MLPTELTFLPSIVINAGKLSYVKQCHRTADVRVSGNDGCALEVHASIYDRALNILELVVVADFDESVCLRFVFLSRKQALT